ncbi:unnamed protein product (macronuclear) [Paramecium tetraurelia]|uniref:CRAL-TRIO domain-containing protein n=1 Tax=Paramecium tetraurelia TaxID=5888 RepID=A0BPK0_PARTE|nr:uncharacterized protein GSPATT00005216001 [Paramecium tetraurelia]CAK60467.1 unnamed protein product [Paramecium tetraurelia]|eukprot:XP_001427865.1 hypothetical protein (macronuclear) [Paramecium tetraurelia strain d4-2]
MDFSYLKPPKQAMQLKHAGIMVIQLDEYIRYYVEGKLKRNVFYNVEFEDVEEELIKKLENLIAKKHVQLPLPWDKQTTLKFCYSGNFDIEMAFQTLMRYLKWKEDSDYQVLTQAGEDILKKGIVFSLGRDKQFRPLIFIQVSKIRTIATNSQCYMCSFKSYIKNLCQCLTMWRNGELQWIQMISVFLDYHTKQKFVYTIQIIKKIIDVTQSNYTASLEQLHLLNPPFVLVAAWKLVEKLMHPETAKKIQFCKDPSYLQEYINEDQLMLKYKGTLPNFTCLWPIINTFRGMGESIHRNMTDSVQKNFMTESAYLSMLDSQYYSIQTFKEIELSKPQIKSQCCSCNIM